MDDDAEIRRKTYQITDIVEQMRQSFLYRVLLHRELTDFFEIAR